MLDNFCKCENVDHETNQYNGILSPSKTIVEE